MGNKTLAKEEFKAAVGKFPTGICVISTSFKGNMYGFTANSFASVSLSPALISFCLDKKSGSFQAFKNCDSFAVNILASDQPEISQHFATKREDKFKDIEHLISKASNLVLIKGAISTLECKKYNEFECGDHFIFVGEVIQASIDESKSPLLYYARSYKEVK